MIAILYPLKMDKNLYEAYSAIYEISANKAISAAKEAEKTRAQKAKAGDTEGAKKAMGQNKKFFNYAKGKRQQENAPKKPTGPMVNKPMPDPTKSYPGTPQIKSSYEPEGEVIDEKLSKEQQAKYDAHVNQKKEEDKKIKKTGNPAFDDPSHPSFARSKIKKNIFDSYDNRYSDNTGKESKEKLKKLEKKRGMKLKGHPQFTREGKFRREWETLKLIEIENYREQFDTWLDAIVEEGYDIARWTDRELIDTFVIENDLWDSRDAVDEALLSEAKDKKGKGSGTKDACYKKVKARYDVWPSAYGSGALSKCRKVGAANWGNSSKKEEVEYDLDEGLGKTLVRAGIKIGGKTGGKIVKTVLKKGGDELKNQAIQTAGDMAVSGARKAGEKVREKIGTNSESLSNWRDELNLLDENRMTAYTAGAGEGSPASRPQVSKKVADDASRQHDKFMFKNRKEEGKTNRSYEKMVRKSIPSDTPNRNKTGRGQPVSYRKGYEKDRDGAVQNKITQGTGSFKDLGKKK